MKDELLFDAIRNELPSSIELLSSIGRTSISSGTVSVWTILPIVTYPSRTIARTIFGYRKRGTSATTLFFAIDVIHHVGEDVSHSVSEPFVVYRKVVETFERP